MATLDKLLALLPIAFGLGLAQTGFGQSPPLTVFYNSEGTAKIVAQYTKVEHREVIAHAVETEGKALDKSLQVDPKDIELILGLIANSLLQAPSARAQDFYDSRFSADLRDSGFLKRLWSES